MTDKTTCPCGRDHSDELMPKSAIAAMGRYDNEVQAIVDKLLADSSLPGGYVDQRDARISIINSIAAKMVSRSAMTILEVVEEQRPDLNHAQQLSEAFSTVTGDTVMRASAMFHGMKKEGILPDFAKFVDHGADDSVPAGATIN